MTEPEPRDDRPTPIEAAQDAAWSNDPRPPRLNQWGHVGTGTKGGCWCCPR